MAAIASSRSVDIARLPAMARPRRKASATKRWIRAGLGVTVAGLIAADAFVLMEDAGLTPFAGSAKAAATTSPDAVSGISGDYQALLARYADAYGAGAYVVANAAPSTAPVQAKAAASASPAAAAAGASTATPSSSRTGAVVTQTPAVKVAKPAMPGTTTTESSAPAAPADQPVLVDIVESVPVVGEPVADVVAPVAFVAEPVAVEAAPVAVPVVETVIETVTAPVTSLLG